MTDTQLPLPGQERVQINIRIDAALRQALRRECERHGHEANAVLERLIEMWLAPGLDRHQYHLDGTLCPMWAMIDSLTQAVRQNVIATTQGATTMAPIPTAAERHDLR